METSRKNIMPNRNEVYSAINGERAYQDSLRKPTVEESVNSASRFANLAPNLSNEIGIIKILADQALFAISMGKGPYGGKGSGLKEGEDSRDVLRKLVAVAVRAMENHGVKERV